jgi:hypothetical protein
MRNLLPKEFTFSHDFCLYLHDCLVQFIVEGERGGFFRTTFEFRSTNEGEELKGNPDLVIFDWLEEKGYSDVLGEALLKAVFPALLSDFCHFIYEALSCSRKAKLTVAYALLRKPLKENLHYLEWLLADPEDLLTTLYNQPSNELAFGKISNPEKAKEIIRKAIDRTLHKELYDVNFLYDLRFNKGAHFGFDALWNKAVHLITTKEPIATEQCNFNFIFSGEEELLYQWQHIYMTLPFLLFYALDICEVLMAIINKEPPSDITEVSFHRSLGFLLWAYEFLRFTDHTGLPEPNLEMLPLNCPKCKHTIQSNKQVITELFLKCKLKCPHCKRRIRLPHFVREGL